MLLSRLSKRRRDEEGEDEMRNHVREPIVADARIADSRTDEPRQNSRRRAPRE